MERCTRVRAGPSTNQDAQLRKLLLKLREQFEHGALDVRSQKLHFLERVDNQDERSPRQKRMHEFRELFQELTGVIAKGLKRAGLRIIQPAHYACGELARWTSEALELVLKLPKGFRDERQRTPRIDARPIDIEKHEWQRSVGFTCMVQQKARQQGGLADTPWAVNE